MPAHGGPEINTINAAHHRFLPISTDDAFPSEMPFQGPTHRNTRVKDRYKFFGEVALEKRFVTTDQLYEALTHQARAKVEGRGEKLLGQVLLELGYMSEAQISQVLDILYPVQEDA